ncbi:hypothetical protein PIB30_065561 [Stylosanthes scabra]|uniref:Uncharacterized protein n=1 Tax=Stylosanthes scabra TaxID=79078 RepID=A0ABU6ZKS2_9FABA|nr:hypothetical protein [Stylosanthes scabra]
MGGMPGRWDRAPGRWDRAPGCGCGELVSECWMTHAWACDSGAWAVETWCPTPRREELAPGRGLLLWCQEHLKLQKVPATELSAIVAPWPFDKWGINLLGPFSKAPG